MVIAGFSGQLSPAHKNAQINERGGGGAAEHAQLHSLRTQGLSQRMLRVRFCTVRRGSVNIPKGEILHVMRQVHDAWDGKKKACIDAEIDESRHPPRPEEKKMIWL